MEDKRNITSLKIARLKNEFNAVTNELRSETAKRKALEKTVETRGDMICEQMETVSLLTERCEKFSAHIKELGALVSELGNGDPGTVKEREGQSEMRDKEILIGLLRRGVAEQGDMLTEYEEQIEQYENRIEDQVDEMSAGMESISALIEGLKHIRRLIGHPQTATTQRVCNHINTLLLAKYK